MAIINIMEKIVDLKMDKYTPESGCCTCETCMDDIKCLVLNQIPSKYVNSPEGELFARVDQIMLKQNSVDLDFAVLNAIATVSKCPRCKVKK